MGTEVTSWQDRLAKDAVAIQDAYKSPIGNLSFSSSGMFYEGVPVVGGTLDVVVLAACFANLWYKDVYDPDVRKNPDCYSLAEERVGMRPDPTSVEAQSAECATCGMLKFGTDPVRHRAKWCKEKMRLIMLPASRVTSPEQVVKGELAQCTLPVMSVANWIKYAQIIGGGIWVVSTRLRWVPDKKTQFKIEFSLVDKITDDSVKSAIAGRIDAAKAHIMAPYPVAEEEEAPKDTGKKKKF
jgi:hypothetical protein